MYLRTSTFLRIVNGMFKRHFIFQNQKYCVMANSDLGDKDEEFRVLELYPMKKDTRSQSKRFVDAQVLPPREKRMPIDQDWPSVWPTAQSFRPSVVPLPVYQGFKDKKAPPEKYANAELMKIPNFLHLTPPAIKRHCEALKGFCTDWPNGLETEEQCMKHFPIEIITSDYCHSSPTIRDERSRIVTLRIKLSSLNLDYHAQDKFLRLIGEERYDVVTDIATIVADRCPLRKQNIDYLFYLLTAIHHESWVTEPWEHEKTEADMEKFFFEGSRIEKHIIDTVSKVKSQVMPETDLEGETLRQSSEVVNYAEAVTGLINEGENEFTMKTYKDSVIKALSVDSNRSRFEAV